MERRQIALPAMDAAHLTADEQRYEYALRSIPLMSMLPGQDLSAYLNRIFAYERIQQVNTMDPARFRVPINPRDEREHISQAIASLDNWCFNRLVAHRWLDTSLGGLYTAASRLTHYYTRLHRMPFPIGDREFVAAWHREVNEVLVRNMIMLSQEAQFPPDVPRATIGVLFNPNHQQQLAEWANERTPQAMEVPQEQAENEDHQTQISQTVSGPLLQSTVNPARDTLSRVERPVQSPIYDRPPSEPRRQPHIQRRNSYDSVVSVSYERINPQPVQVAQPPPIPPRIRRPPRTDSQQSVESMRSQASQVSYRNAQRREPVPNTIVWIDERERNRHERQQPANSREHEEPVRPSTHQQNRPVETHADRRQVKFDRSQEPPRHRSETPGARASTTRDTRFTSQFGRDLIFNRASNRENTFEHQTLKRWIGAREYIGTPHADDKTSLSLQTFMSRVKSYQSAQEVEDIVVLKNIGQSLAGHAGKWWENKKHDITTVEEFERALRMRFEPDTRDPNRLIAKFYNTRQREGEFLLDYYDEKMSIYRRLPTYQFANEADAVEAIVEGMTTSYAKSFIERMPRTLIELDTFCNQLVAREPRSSRESRALPKSSEPLRRYVRKAVNEITEITPVNRDQSDSEHDEAEIDERMEVLAMNQYKEIERAASNNANAGKTETKKEHPISNEVYQKQIGDKPWRCHNCLIRGHNHLSCPYEMRKFCYGCGAPNTMMKDCNVCKSRPYTQRPKPKNGQPGSASVN